METPTPAPTPEPEPAIDFYYYIQRDDYSNVTFVKDTDILRMARELQPFLPEELHRNTVNEIMKKLESNWRKRVARTVHSQLTAIFSRNRSAILEAQTKRRDFTVEDYEQFEKKLDMALAQAKQVDKECNRQAEEERRLSREGNIKFITVPRKASK